MWYGYDKQEPQLHTQAASKHRTKLQGQGQGPKAERLLADATQNGSWVGASDALFGELWLSGSRDSQRAAGVLCVGFDVEPRFGERPPFTQGQQARELDLQMWMGAALREIIGSMTGAAAELSPLRFLDAEVGQDSGEPLACGLRVV